MIKYPPAPESDVVVSCRVRLARNYSDIPFASKMEAHHAKETVSRALKSLENAHMLGMYRLYPMSELCDTERRMLVEKHLVSLDLISNSEKAAALISTGETVSIMINEEDHLRIQGLLPGLQLEKAAQLAFHADDVLSKDAPIAFDSKWGYLTACPTNAGTGLRASALVHLPAITLTKQMGAVIQAFGKIGFTVRGLYGEGTEAEGNLYQLSNQTAMGRSEEDVIRSLIDACQQVSEQEREARKSLVERDQDAFIDKMMRSVGILLNARLLEEKEFMRLMSDVRLAAGIGIINAPIAAVDELITRMQPASLSSLADTELTARDLMLLRASEVRSSLSALINDNDTLFSEEIK
ncbi:MAG: protein arginine kinase [Clostridia bacterium]|nr:protein arginine kinase [Clostridia bacterium]MBQ2434236.1 protein arginine kinase [Clostridia bacterium]